MYIMKKAIVTGGESGIGKGIVKALSKEGYEIVSSYYYEKEETGYSRYQIILLMLSKPWKMK